MKNRENLRQGNLFSDETKRVTDIRISEWVCELTRDMPLTSKNPYQARIDLRRIVSRGFDLPDLDGLNGNEVMDLYDRNVPLIKSYDEKHYLPNPVL